MRALIIFAGIALASCTTLGSAPSTSAQQAVYRAESAFAAALPIAVAYEQLPACGGQYVICSDPATVSKVTAAAKAARESLKIAENAVRSGSNSAAITNAAVQAESDVEVFAALAATLGK